MQGSSLAGAVGKRNLIGARKRPAFQANLLNVKAHSEQNIQAHNLVYAHLGRTLKTPPSGMRQGMTGSVPSSMLYYWRTRHILQDMLMPLRH